MWKDPNTFSVSRITVPFYFLGAKSFLITSFLTACFSYIGTWKLYRLFNKLYPGTVENICLFNFFYQALIFWGGGIMKDSYVLGATCWITSNFFITYLLLERSFFGISFLCY